MIRFVLTLLLTAASAAAVSAQTFTTRRVARSGDTPPGAGAAFGNSFANGFPAVDASGRVSFVGNIGGVPSVYTGDGVGPLTAAAATGAAIPNGGGATFADFGASTGYGAGGVAFWGANAASSPTLQGIYLALGGTVTRVADTTVTAPGQTTAFTGFSSGQIVAVSGANVGFRATFAGGSGLYAWVNSGLVLVADTSTAIPGGTGTFGTLNSNQALSGTVSAFRGNGSSSQQGVYLRDLSNPANPVVRVTDKTRTLPGTTNLITQVFEPSLVGTTSRFIASAGTGTQRVVASTWNGSSTAPAFAEAVVSKTGDAVPDQTGLTFTGYQGFVPADGTNAAFIGRFGASSTGIYFHDGADLRRVIDTTQPLDGKTVTSLLLGPDAVAGHFVTYQALFADSTQGIYVVEFTPVPEPGLLLGLAAAGLLAARHRRSRPTPTPEVPSCTA